MRVPARNVCRLRLACFRDKVVAVAAQGLTMGGLARGVLHWGNGDSQRGS